MEAKKRKTGVVKSVDRKDVEKHEIYSYAVSTPPGGPHRKKTITVRGIPGSAFTLLAQNEDNEVYSFQGGGFDRTASSFEGFIPESGVFKAIVDTQVARNVDVRLDTKIVSTASDVVVDAEGEYVVPTTTTATVIHPQIASSSTTVGSEETFSLGIQVDTTGLSNIELDGRKEYVSKLIRVGSQTLFKFEFVLVTPDAYSINLVRQPLFDFLSSNADDERGFTLYDGSVYKNGASEIVNELAHIVNLDGRKILSDIKYNPILERSEPDFHVEFFKVELYGEAKPAEDSVGHSEGFGDVAVISGSINIGSMGKANTTLKLMPFNFLEVLAK